MLVTFSFRSCENQKKTTEITCILFETNSSHLKIDGNERKCPIFSGVYLYATPDTFVPRFHSNTWPPNWHRSESRPASIARWHQNSNRSNTRGSFLNFLWNPLRIFRIFQNRTKNSNSLRLSNVWNLPNPFRTLP